MQQVFILGAGRSGTKILRDCLAKADLVTAIPYDVGYVWKYGNQGIPHDELLPEHARAEVAEYLQSTMKKMAIRSASGSAFDIMLEKSVPNTLRPAFMREVFPDAKFIHLVRNGRDVIESSMRNWVSPADTGYFWDKLRYFPISNAPYALWYAANRVKKLRKSKDVQLWGPRYMGIQEDANTLPLIDVCTLQWLNCVNTCHQQLKDFPSDQVMEVRYEEFVADQNVVARLCDFAGIDDVDQVLAFHEVNIKSHIATKDRTTLSAEQMQRVSEIAGDMLLNYGY